jgi:hypothetical protein
MRGKSGGDFSFIIVLFMLLVAICAVAVYMVGQYSAAINNPRGSASLDTANVTYTYSNVTAGVNPTLNKTSATQLTYVNGMIWIAAALLVFAAIAFLVAASGGGGRRR